MLAIETAVGGSGLLGYIKAHKPELKMRDYEVYKGVYCSLCKRMGRRYTPAAQLLLSYDFAFFALLKMSVHPEVSIFTESRCPYNPFVRCKKCVGDPGGVLDLCADAAVITAFYKLKDDLKDSGFTKRLLALLFLPAVWLMFLKPNDAYRLFTAFIRCHGATSASRKNTGCRCRRVGTTHGGGNGITCRV